MGKLNEIQQQSTISYGSNSFTTRIEENTVIFDSAKDSFTFADDTTFEGDVSVSGAMDLDSIDANELTIANIDAETIKINGTETTAFTQEEKIKLANLTGPMQIKGRVDTVAELPTTAALGDVYLVGAEGIENYAEYIATEIDPVVWEKIGDTQKQADWTQTDTLAPDYIKNKPTLATVATSGSYNDLSNKPTVLTTQVATTGSAAATIDFNKFTYLTNAGLTSITINANSKTAGYMNEASGRFTTGSVVSLTSITMSDSSTIQWKDGVDLTALEANTDYIFSVVGDDAVGYFGNIGKF